MKKIVILLITLSSLNIYSQKKTKTNNKPIIFSEIIFGGTKEIKGNGGISIGGEINYQYKKNLFSIRYLENSQFETDVLLLSPLTPFPFIRVTDKNQEIGILYGKRSINNNSSLSFSGGISLNSYSSNFINENNENYKTKDSYLGFPFEVNLKWFKPKKMEYKIYCLIPVGKPTSFGRSIGFKLIGNISKNSFIGLGLNYGFGVHKKYESSISQ